MKARDISTEQLELDELRELSARIGADPILTQASSGNTSVKIDDTLWIKGSGRWLVQADLDDFFVPVKLSRAIAYISKGLPIAETVVLPSGQGGASIETAMHAVLPSKMVVHVHSINAIAWAVREDGKRQLQKRLTGIEWQWIPYTLSGISLAHSIQRALSTRPKTNVLILGNHGLVICGDDCRSVQALLSEVEERLTIEPRAAPPADPTLFREEFTLSDWIRPECADVHALATDPISRRILSGGVLYPCQAIFLASTLPTYARTLCQSAGCSAIQTRTTGTPIVVEGRGVLYNRQTTQAEKEMLMGLSGVIQRISESAPIRYLTELELLEVLKGGGESYWKLTDTNYRAKAAVPSTS